MAHVLLVTADRQLISQAELQATELEKNGHVVTYSPVSHPLRLLSKNFDTLHLLVHALPLNSKLTLFTVAAKALGLTVIVSLFEPSEFGRISKFQLKSIDAITTFSLGQYNQLKFFNKNKMIFAGFVDDQKSNSNLKKTQKKDQSEIVFPILHSMNELPEKINLTRTGFIVDASRVDQARKKVIKHQWASWKKQHLQNENAWLVTEWQTIEQNFHDKSLVMVTSHLDSNAQQTLDFYNKALQHKAIWIPNKNQASAFSAVWNQLESRLIADADFTFIDDFYQGLSPFHFQSAQINEVKSNELTRLYSRVQNEKSSFANRLSDNIKA